MLHIPLDVWVAVLAADQSLSVEHGIRRIVMQRVLRAVADTSLREQQMSMNHISGEFTTHSRSPSFVKLTHDGVNR